MATYVKIRIRRDHTDAWASVNPVLALGEAGYDLDLKKLKIGRDNLPWNDLEYVDDSTLDAVEKIVRELSGISKTAYNKMRTPIQGKPSINSTQSNYIKDPHDGDIVYSMQNRTFYYYDVSNVDPWQEVNFNIGGVDEEAVKNILNNNIDTLIQNYNDVPAHDVAKMSVVQTLINNTISDYYTKDQTDGIINNILKNSDLAPTADNSDKLDNIIKKVLITALGGTTGATLEDTLKNFWNKQMKQLLEDSGSISSIDETMESNVDRLTSILGGNDVDIDTLWNGKDDSGNPIKDKNGNPTYGLKERVATWANTEYGPLGKEYEITQARSAGTSSNIRVPKEIQYYDTYPTHKNSKVRLYYDTTTWKVKYATTIDETGQGANKTYEYIYDSTDSSLLIGKKNTTYNPASDTNLG